MNIEQIKADLDNNVIVSRQTGHKLVEAALMMRNDLTLIAFEGDDGITVHRSSERADSVLDKVEAL